MHRATTATAPHRHHRRPPRDRLSRSLQSLGNLITTLPLALSTPPPSRSPSPGLPGKRKSDPDSERPSAKRQRISSTSQSSQRLRSHQPPPPSLSRPTPSQTLRSDPSEEGELRDDPVPGPSSSSTSVPSATSEILNSNLPIRRPRRGAPSEDYFKNLQEKYEALGHAFKYSGGVRWDSCHVPTHGGAYKALENPPPVNSAYHIHGHVISRLESTEAMLCYGYALWAHGQRFALRMQVAGADKKKREALVQDQKATFEYYWNVMGGLYSRLHHVWDPSATEEGEKFMWALSRMVESYHWEKRVFQRLESCFEMDHNLWIKLGAKEREYLQQKQAAAAPPRMLPSPESLAGSSANSTPASRSAGTPEQSKKAAEELSKEAMIQLQYRTEARFNSTVTPYYVYTHQQCEKAAVHASRKMIDAQKYLTLPAMAKHFPRTFTRMINSSYSYTDECEPDMEDDDGELMWPNQLMTGEGWVWLITMGRAMVREYGKKFGYTSYEGLVPDPNPPPNRLER
ncbi:hypothetical protein QCA50_004537 [Cerrena zonata]|uniref:Uncharacterized protein n=1 Tax=Cerrena zonata TaxID=2478898 RepID=A0AAW0GHR4_9APHY